MGNVFLDLTFIIVIAAIFSLIFRFFKQPEILAYILTGIVIAAFPFLGNPNKESIQALSELGVTLLLFMVGLEIRISELLSIGKSLLLSSVAQVIFTFILGYVLAFVFKFDFITSVYIATALTFSSTIIVIKLLSDQREMHSLHAKFSLGILLFQDIFAILFLIVLSGFNPQTGGAISIINFGAIFIKAIVLILGIIFLSKKVFPKIVGFISRSPETLFLASLAWVFGLAALVSSEYIGFSIEIGGFLAGVALANSLVSYQIIAKAKILRDFFIVIFFVLLGAQMSFSNISSVLIPVIILSLFVLIIKPIIVMIIFSVLGYRKRTSFLTGVSLSQISEFSLILIFLGLKLGHIKQDVVSIITLVGLISFAVSTYMITHWKNLYKKVSNKIDFLERTNLKKDLIFESDDVFDDVRGHVVVIGGDQMGESIVEALEDKDKTVIIVDFDPNMIKKYKERKVHRIFGDISDLDIQQRAKIDEAKLVISTIPDIQDNLMLLKELKHENRRAKVVMMALDSKDARELYDEGADYVVLPHLAGGRQIAKIIVDDNLEHIESLKLKDKTYL